jgi:hypothetical protein
MEKNVKGIIAVVIVGILGFVGYKYFTKKGILSGAKSIADDNFGLLQKQTGRSANNQDALVIPFNDNKNKAQFYSNNRVIIFDTTKTPPVRIKSGTYSQGGYNIKLDGGKDIMNTSSVFLALLETLK